MLNENWELISTVTASYTEYTDFDLFEILKEYNEDNNWQYKLEDIENIWVKWNTIHLEMNDWNELTYEWIFSDWDYKRPDELLYNQFTPLYTKENI